MNKIVDVMTWVQENSLFDIPEMPLMTQLESLEKGGTGVGFVFGMDALPTQEDKSDAECFELISVPVVKIKGRWVTVADENLSDILASIIRMLAPSEGELKIEPGPAADGPK